MRIESIPYKIFCDQLIGTPISIFTFISYSAYWDGLNVDKYLNKVSFLDSKMLFITYNLAGA